MSFLDVNKVLKEYERDIKEAVSTRVESVVNQLNSILLKNYRESLSSVVDEADRLKKEIENSKKVLADLKKEVTSSRLELYNIKKEHEDVLHQIENYKEMKQSLDKLFSPRAEEEDVVSPPSREIKPLVSLGPSPPGGPRYLSGLMARASN